MKKRMVIAVLLLALLLSGCTVVTPGKGASSDDALKALGVAYSAGEYRIDGAACYGFVTSGQKMIMLYIDVPKVFLDGQKITVTSLTGVELRNDGSYLYEHQGDLTPFVANTQSRNGGALLYVRLDNEVQWKSTDGKAVENNDTFVGTVNITFRVSD